MGKNTPVANLTRHLHAERDALEAFVALLESEQLALVEGQVEQLLALAQSKTQAVQRLNELAGIRRNELFAMGAPVEVGSMVAWLQSHAATSLPVWREIQQLITQAQDINRNNGALIQTRLRNNQQALTVLHNAASNAHGLYGPDGQPHLSTSGRTLGSV